MDWIVFADLSADGSLLASGGWTTRSATVWDARTSDRLWNTGELEPRSGTVKILFSPSGAALPTVTLDRPMVI
jgi:hypothetical protein